MPTVSVKDFEELLERLEASRQSRLRAWEALQRLRAALAEHGRRDIPRPARKTFEREGQILEVNLREALEDRNRALRDLCKAVRRFQAALLHESNSESRDAARRAMLEALCRAEDLAC